MKKLLFIITCIGFFAIQAIGKTSSIAVEIASDSSGSGCNNPIHLNSITVLNTQCGIGTGGIILDVQGATLNYSYNWTPNVSSGNIAFNLMAGVYSVQIVRNNQPDCVLDTTVIVNNSNGPVFQVASVEGASCLAGNGKVTLTPDNLTYTWSNGTMGAVNSTLAAGCYYVTATQPNGCYSILRVCVPRVNQLNTNYTILKQAKCGRSTGSVQLDVTGGSGNYSYSLGNSSIIAGLAAGSYTDIIQDNSTGCTDTVSFVIQPVEVSGSVDLTIYNVKCPGANNGFVNFNPIPGANFASPFTFVLRDANNNPAIPVFPGNLAPGLYTLYVVDADSCAIPPTTFFISEPPPFVLQKTVAPQTCTHGGQILLSLGGGNGHFTVDWADLPGTDDGPNRLNVTAGLYSAVIYDSLFCQYNLDTVLVARQCTTPDTLFRFLKAGTADTFCLDVPVGVAAGNAHFNLLGGGTTGNSAFGSWILKPNGCLIYTAKTTVGYALDTVCISETIDFAGLSRSVCIIVSITATEPAVQQVYFSVLPNEAATACGTIPGDIPLPTINLLSSSGLSGTSGSFGSYTINPVSACITFQSLSQSGYNVDDIGVAVCGGNPYHCKIIHYLPTVLPATTCIDAIQLPASLTLETDNCPAGASACVPLPYAETVNYSILDNGLPYQAGLQPCDNDTLTGYALNQIPATGPYTLNQWLLNGQVVGGSFSDINGLLALLNILDVNGNWHIYNNTYIVGGSSGNTYGTMKITSANGTMKTLDPSIQYVPQGTIMHFSIGQHEVVFRSVLSGCADTMNVQATCTACPPLHTYTPDALGNIRWTVSNCDFDTTFCTNLLGSQINNYEVKDNGTPFTNFTICGNNVGFSLDTGYHQLSIREISGGCEYLVNLYLTCPPPQADSLLAVADNATTTRVTSVQIHILDNDVYRDPIQVEILAKTGYGTFSYEPIQGVVSYVPDTAQCGLATLQYRIKDTLGRQSAALVSVNVTCDKIIIYNGLSPNGDNLNDVWHIPGIERYPQNEVQVFNRWGSRVLQQKGYTNQTAWAGEWNGKTLPDGTYYYIIDLGDGSDILSGYLEILR